MPKGEEVIFSVLYSKKKKFFYLVWHFILKTINDNLQRI